MTRGRYIGIRCVQGHSIIHVNEERIFRRVDESIHHLIEVAQHATQWASIAPILRDGLRPGGPASDRTHVYMSVFPHDDPRSAALFRKQTSVTIILDKKYLFAHHELYLTGAFAMLAHESIHWWAIDKILFRQNTLKGPTISRPIYESKYRYRSWAYLGSLFPPAGQLSDQIRLRNRFNDEGGEVPPMKKPEAAARDYMRDNPYAAICARCNTEQRKGLTECLNCGALFAYGRTGYADPDERAQEDATAGGVFHPVVAEGQTTIRARGFVVVVPNAFPQQAMRGGALGSHFRSLQPPVPAAVSPTDFGPAAAAILVSPQAVPSTESEEEATTPEQMAQPVGTPPSHTSPTSHAEEQQGVEAQLAGGLLQPVSAAVSGPAVAGGLFQPVSAADVPTPDLPSFESMPFGVPSPISPTKREGQPKAEESGGLLQPADVPSAQEQQQGEPSGGMLHPAEGGAEDVDMPALEDAYMEPPVSPEAPQVEDETTRGMPRLLPVGEDRDVDPNTIVRVETTADIDADAGPARQPKSGAAASAAAQPAAFGGLPADCKLLSSPHPSLSSQALLLHVRQHRSGRLRHVVSSMAGPVRTTSSTASPPSPSARPNGGVRDGTTCPCRKDRAGQQRVVLAIAGLTTCCPRGILPLSRSRLSMPNPL